MIRASLFFLAWVLATERLVEAALLRGERKEQVETETELWRPCGNENEAIQQEGAVRFGFGLTWVEGNVPRGASCTISTFGEDPAPGIQKICECSGVAPVSLKEQQHVTDDMGLAWSHCAAEGESCQCDSGTVRFGSTSRWVVKEQGFAKGASVSCTQQFFDGKDPVLGKHKECWCMDAQPSSLANPSVAIVLLSRRAPDLKTWLQYHLDYMGVKHIFMDVEDSPHFDEAWQTLSKADQDRVTVWKASATGNQDDSRPADDYTTLQARQLQAMRRAKAASKQMGIEWLLHIDDDELLYAPLHRPIGEILASVPKGFSQAYLPNVEAIYDSADVKSCFTETAKVNMNRYTFVSYANGKAAVRVSDDAAVPAGPHQWRTPEGLEVSSIHLDAETFGSPLWLVHFESCPFTRWEDKFWELGNTSPEKVNGIPFKFYKESITRMMHCRTRKAKGDSFLEEDGEECSQRSLKDLWSRWKTKRNPKIREIDLMPITIPWGQIQAM